MKVFTVYFEICGKKMRMNLKANNETEAKKVITDKIIFHKIEEDYSIFLEGELDEIKNIFDGIFKGKI
jgi:hypothetical protein